MAKDQRVSVRTTIVALPNPLRERNKLDSRDSTLFEQLFEHVDAVARHRAGPLLEARLAFLTQLADRGVLRSTIRVIAQRLLVFMKTLPSLTVPSESSLVMRSRGRRRS